MDECDVNLVARLVALNERTRKAWAHPHNKPFYVAASFQDFPVRDGPSRGATPFEEDGDGGNYVKDTEPELRISFNSRPKNINKGWVFGRDKTSCDVYCGERDDDHGYNIGRQTFSITLSNQRRVILQHTNSANRTMVQYDDQKAGDRRKFVWIMFPTCKNITITSANHLMFQVKVAKPGAQTDLYLSHRSRFLRDVKHSMPSMPSLSEATTAGTTIVNTPDTKPFYYVRKDQVLGSGSFGQVYVVMDASTGVVYAGKTFFGDFHLREAEILAKQSHVSHTVCFITYLLGVYVVRVACPKKCSNRHAMKRLWTRANGLDR